MSLLKYRGYFLGLAMLMSLSARGQNWLQLQITGPATATAGVPTAYKACATTAASSDCVDVTNAVTWVATDGAVVSAPGLVTFAKAGTPHVHVSYGTDAASMLTQNYVVTVSAGAAASSFLMLPSPSVTVPVGGTVPMQVLVTYGSGASAYVVPAKIADVSLGGTPDATIATIKAGVITGVKVGTTSFTVTTASLAAQTVQVTVVAATAVSATTVTAHKPTLVQKVSDLTLSVTDNGSDALSVYEYEPGFGVTDCANSDANTLGAMDIPASHRTLKSIVVSSTNSSTTFTPATALTTPGPVTLTFTIPVVAGATLCVVETASGAAPVWSAPIVAPDDNDFGRFRTYFTAGVQASNQLSTNGASSTAGEYLEGGFISSWVRAKDATERGKAHGRPGLTTVTDIRLSPIPVSAPQTTTTATSSGSGGSTSTSATTAPNALSSQQSIRTTAAVYSPWRLTNWHSRADYFTVAPAARAGFGTLLNPSNSGTTTSGTSSAGTTIQTVATQYQAAYYFWSLGARLAWDRYSTDTDKAAQTMTQVYVTFGQYSNLPSYACVPTTPANVPSTATTTACNQGKYAPVGSGSTATNTFTYGRTIRPRLDIEALARMPGYPFVLGIDANLQQYGLGGKSNLDYMNKPGNDIRIYVGLQINFSTLLSKLGGGS